MHSSTFLASIACLFTASSALSLNLWTQDGCRGSRSSCINAGYAVCCTGGSPFCRSGNCDGCFVGNDIYTFNAARCTGASYDYCRAAVGNGCCRAAGGGNTCAIVAYVGNARTNIVDVNEEDCVASVKPNQLEYTDNEGVVRQIYIPKARYEEATQLAVDEDWAALSEFPVWGEP